jgi:hypothetical protein
LSLDAAPHIPAAPPTAAYLARRGVAPQWRAFLRALVETLEEHLDAEGRTALMRAIGRRMAEAMPLPHCGTLAELEARMNDALAVADWGYCELALDTGAGRLVVVHSAAPAVAAGGDAEGSWVGAVLEGLYGGWFAGQPGANAALQPAMASYAPGSATLHYARG